MYGLGWVFGLLLHFRRYFEILRKPHKHDLNTGHHSQFMMVFPAHIAYLLDHILSAGLAYARPCSSSCSVALALCAWVGPPAAPLYG